MTGAKALIQALEKEGVDVVFGLPGGAMLPIYDGLGVAIFRHIRVRHEHSSGHMSNAQASLKLRVGLCVSTSRAGAAD